MQALLELIFGGTYQAWAWINAICAVLLLIEMIVMLASQRGANRQRRWAALGPFVAACVALLLAWTNWQAANMFFLAARYCSFVLADPGCRAVVVELDQKLHFGFDALGWLIVGAAVALAFVAASLLVSRAKPEPGAVGSTPA